MFFNSKVRLSVLAVSLSLSLNIAAEKANNSDEDNNSDIVVWGTKVTSNSVYLDGEELAIKQADHISDLLRTIPGVDVGGAHSLNQRITIRSMDDKDLKITIDGANQNTYMYHHMGNLQIHADILKSVDINVGKNSVVDSGLGGAVRFETKEAKDMLSGDKRFGGYIQTSYDDNSATGFALSAFGQLTDQFDFLAYFNQIGRDNYKVGGGKILDASGNVVPGTDGNVRGLKGDLKDALIKFGFDITDNQRFEIGYEAYEDKGDYSYRPDMGLATDLAIASRLNIPLVYPTEFTRDTLTFNYDIETDSSLFKFAAFKNTSTLWRDERGLGSWRPPAAVIKEGEAENSGFNLLANSDLAESHALTYGFEFVNYDTQYSSNNTVLSGEKSKNRAFFIQDKIQLTESFSITPGLRHDSVDLNSKVINKKFSEVTGALSLDFQATPNLLLRASATQLFKDPEISEVFIGAGLFDVPNSDIKAETGLNKEIALDYQNNNLGVDNFRTGITIFDTDIENYIYDYAPCSPAVVTGCRRSWKDNVGDMNVNGYEFYIGFDHNNFSSLLSYSNSDSELDAFSQYAPLNNARIDRTQGDTLSLSIDYNFAETDLTLHWDAMIVDDVSQGIDLDGATRDNSKGGFNVHNISAKWRPESIEGLVLTLGIDNVFDEFYASQSSRTGLSSHPFFGDLYLLDYEPGRNIKFTVSYTF